MSSADDEAIRGLLVELRLLEGSARTLQSRLEVIQSAINENLIANTSLEGIKGKPKGAQALVPLGGGSFVQVELTGTDKIVMGVGAGVCIEKSLDDSILELKNRVAELEKVGTSVQQQLSQTVTRLEEGRRKLNELVQKKGGVIEE